MLKYRPIVIPPMSVQLLPNIHDQTIVNMPNWESIQRILNSRNQNNSLMEAIQNHLGTHARIVFADYHQHLLDQIYIPHTTPRFTETPEWALAEMFSIIANLYSALDSLASEINVVYGLGVPTVNVGIYHNIADHKKGKPSKKCLRCMIDQNSKKLGKYLDRELSRDWFGVFRELRHQMTHQHIPVYNVTLEHGDPATEGTTVLLIPNNPALRNPQSNDYSDRLDFNNYCKARRMNVVAIIEQAYKIATNKFRSL